MLLLRAIAKRKKTVGEARRETEEFIRMYGLDDEVAAKLR